MRKKAFTAADIALCAVFVALMTAGAYIKIPFPLVPLTFQTVISVLSGLLLGWKRGVVAMSVYMFSGLLGLPVFADGGGISYILKPSFGYIIGFAAASATAGVIAGKSSSSKRLMAAALAAFAVNYAIGIPYCLVCANLLGVKAIAKLFITGNLIYMPKDAALCILAAMLAKILRPALRKGGLKA